jgi:hypothetical protein
LAESPVESSLRAGTSLTEVALTIEVTGGVIVNERGTVVTYRQKCEECGYVYDYNKTTIVPAYSTRSARNFTCPECGNYQDVLLKHHKPA